MSLTSLRGSRGHSSGVPVHEDVTAAISRQQEPVAGSGLHVVPRRRPGSRSACLCAHTGRHACASQTRSTWPLKPSCTRTSSFGWRFRGCARGRREQSVFVQRWRAGGRSGGGQRRTKRGRRVAWSASPAARPVCPRGRAAGTSGRVAAGPGGLASSERVRTWPSAEGGARGQWPRTRDGHGAAEGGPRDRPTYLSP